MNSIKLKHFKPALVLGLITTIVGALLIVTTMLLPDTSGTLSDKTRALCVELTGEGSFELIAYDDWGILPTESFEKPPEITKVIQKDDGLIIFEVTVAGFKPPDGLTMLVAMNENGSVRGVRAVTIKDTPGFGDRVADHDFLAGFIGKSTPVELVKEGTADENTNEVDGLARATYSAKGVAEAVNIAIETYPKLIINNNS